MTSNKLIKKAEELINSSFFTSNKINKSCQKNSFFNNTVTNNNENIQ